LGKKEILEEADEQSTQKEKGVQQYISPLNAITG
jgi:hypothetical protein